MSAATLAQAENLELRFDTGNGTALGVRLARSGELVDAYPAGAHDRELLLLGEGAHAGAAGTVRPTSTEVTRIAGQVLELDPHCRRVVIAVPERDLDAIAWAEDAGFRYVVDVETRSGSWSLLVVEPQWVIDQPQALEDIPIDA